MAESDPWWVNGTLYENCTCQLLCPAHVSFKQDCEGEKCLGYWGVHVTKGRYGPLVLDEQNAVVVYASPPSMHEGDWMAQIYLDEAVDSAQREALEHILNGDAGGPWRLLAKFVATRLETRTAPITYADIAGRKTLKIQGVLDSVVDSLESKKTGQTATLGNLFNVIHAPMQFLATGTSTFKNDAFDWKTKSMHGLFSEFSWTGP